MIEPKLWTRFAVRSACAAAIILGLQGLLTSAQSTDPSGLPLLTQEGLIYLGGFRVPADPMNGVDFSYGGTPIAFHPATNSLFVGAGDEKVAELSLPEPINRSDVNALPAATYLQRTFVDPTEGRLQEVSTSNVVIYGLLVYGNRLYGSAAIYYDANNVQRVSHFSRSLQLTERSFSGWSRVWDAGRSGFVSGMMALVPPEWQARLGGPAITGQCCISIITRTSFGPAAFAFDPAKVGQPVVSATPLLYYPSDHPTLGEWTASNSTYGSTTRVAGVAIIAGTRTALFIGSNGLGPYCYGDGTADKAAADASRGHLCYDPTNPHKGPHGYPYRYQVWAYDLNDFAAVKAGKKKPWEVRPYDVWELTFPTPAWSFSLGGVAYDAQHQMLYVSQRVADGFYARRPVIHAFKLSATAQRGYFDDPHVARGGAGVAAHPGYPKVPVGIGRE